jgi:nucleotidyltransferase/DNA polymerase involved in DNA repair
VRLPLPATNLASRSAANDPRVGDIDCLGKPVVVLSNDGGCVIARSNQAEALGIETGTVTSRRTRFDIAGGVVLS